MTTIIDAGLDYLTATMVPSMSQYCDMNEAAQSWFIDAVECGLNVKEARSKGYEGLRLDGTFYGKREDSLLWETSGPIAGEVARYLGERELNPRITRADFQVTHVTGEVPRTWAEDKLEDARIGALLKGRKARNSIGRFSNFAGDTGFTLGRRGGKAYFRSYLAGTKHPDKYDANAIRDESEFRSERAVELFSMYQASRSQVATTLAIVRGHMEKNYLWEPWHDEAEIAEFPPLCYDASEERSMLWIENHVLSTIERLGKGPYRARLVNALNGALKYKAS